MAITIRKGTAADLDAFVNLLCIVRESMLVKEWFYLDSKEDFRQHMASGIMELWLAEDSGRVVGVFDLLIPGLREWNYGYALDMTTEELIRSVNMDSVAVHPDYQGLGLQRKLLLEAEQWLSSRGNWTLLCTVHPENRFSLNNVKKLGYEVQKQLSIYGSVRYLLQKNI